MSVILTTVTTATTGLQAAIVGVLAAAIAISAIVFGIKWGWKSFRGMAKSS